MRRPLLSLSTLSIAGALCVPLFAVPAGAAPAVDALAAAASLIDSGGTGYTTPGGQTWSSDSGFNGGSVSMHNKPIAGTQSDGLFQSQRWGMSGYAVPVGWDGTYRVSLKFAETYWTAPGERVFSVRLEGQSWITNLDIAKSAGPNRALTVTEDVTVTDGVVNLAFSATRDEAVVSAISVRPLTADPDPDPDPPPGDNLSGLPWESGVYMPGSSRGDVGGFANWRGRPLDTVVDFAAWATWNDVVNPSWLYDAWAGTPYTKAISVAMIPSGEGASISACASGAYNSKWVQFGQTIKARGLDDESIIRLGWEFNGNWFPWSAYDPAAWAQCWRNVFTSAESAAPALRWDWNVNRGVGQALTDASRAYPGDAYVDIIGVDSYDMWPGATSEASWNEHVNGAGGLNTWASFARAHGKTLSVPEWGVYPGTAQAGHNGGDNPFYMNKMVDYFQAQGRTMAYEAYFNEDMEYYAGAIFNPNQNPRASQAYLDRYER